MMNPEHLISIIEGVIDSYGRKPYGNDKVKLAYVDYGFVADDYPQAKPRVIFDGESTVTGQEFECISPYWPQPGDRVLMLPVGNTYVILGSLGLGGGIYTYGGIRDESVESP